MVDSGEVILTTEQEEVAFVKTSKARARNIRKRDGDLDNESSPGSTKIAKISHQNFRQKMNPLVQGAHGSKQKLDLSYESTGTVVSSVVEKYHVDDDEELRAKEEAIKKSKEEAAGAAGSDSKLYRGMSNYTKFVEKGELPKAARAGPVKAPSHVKASVRFDYQPDICKDYKETGFCGYGDNCKFLHDRGDYKTGWQLEKEWDDQQKGKKKKAAGDKLEFLKGGKEKEEEEEGEEEEDERLPWACTICRDSFRDPVVTKCGHYFCEKCALQHNKKSKRCFNCDEPTLGIFNVAKNLILKLKQKEERKRLRAAALKEEEEQ